MSSSGNKVPLPGGSYRQPWISSNNNETSNPDNLHEIPLSGLQSGIAEHGAHRPISSGPSASPGAWRASDESSTSTAQRLAELRLEMTSNQKQIQQLAEAHRAVHNAVSGINAMQDLLAVKEHKGDPPIAEEENASSEELRRNATTRTNKSTGSRHSDYQREQERPEKPMNQPPAAERQSWVDDEYYEENPWYGRPKSKPVFSLGRPLPHTSRGRKKMKAKKAKVKRSLKRDEEPDLEKGQSSSKGNRTGKSVRITDDTADDHAERQQDDDAGDWGNRSRRDHKSTKRNDAGEPVYDYQPWNNGPGGQSHQVKDSEETVAGEDDDHGDRFEEGQKYKVDGEPVGQSEDEEVEEGGNDPDELRNWWARLRAKYPEPLAEFLCTAMSTYLGLCATISVNLSANQSSQYGTYETSCWAWGFAFMFGIYLGGGVSGAHMNPAISICLSIFRGFPWRQCAIYIVIQFLASFAAGALAYGTYYEAIHYIDPEMTETWTCFFSYPQPWVSTGTAVGNQCIAGAVMTIAVFALGDDQNNPPGAGMHAFILGLLQTTLKFCLGYNTGSSLNPASDFGPRLVAWLAGYRVPEAFRNGWWIYGPWVAALIGSIIGCVCYDATIFVGSESPVNYRVPERFRRKLGLASKF